MRPTQPASKKETASRSPWVCWTCVCVGVWMCASESVCECYFVVCDPIKAPAGGPFLIFDSASEYSSQDHPEARGDRSSNGIGPASLFVGATRSCVRPTPLPRADLGPGETAMTASATSIDADTATAALGRH